MRKFLANIWVTLGLLVLAVIALVLLANIGKVIAVIIFLLLVPVLIDLLLGLMMGIGLAVVGIFYLVWEWLSPSQPQ